MQGQEGALVHHLFFALLPDADCVRQATALGESLIARHALQARVRGERLHVTLMSLGWEPALSDQRLAWARAAAASVRAQPFGLRLDRARSFARAPGLRLDRARSFARAPGLRRPCVLCGSDAVHAGFFALHAALHAALWPQGAVPHVTPHMTLCYSRQAVPEQAVTPLCWTVRSFALLHNRRGSPGPYELLGEWPLAAASQ